MIESVKKRFEILKAGVLKTYEERGMRATGKFAEALEVKSETIVRGVSGKLLGLVYAKWLNEGRRPGKRPPIAPIIEWVKAKGIASESKAVRRIANKVANKIANEGTKWHKERSGLLTDNFTAVFINDTIKSVGSSFLDTKLRGLIRVLKK